jgi:hypothetical protein
MNPSAARPIAPIATPAVAPPQPRPRVSTGTIAGVALGGVAAFTLLLAAIAVFRRRRRRRRRHAAIGGGDEQAKFSGPELPELPNTVAYRSASELSAADSSARPVVRHELAAPLHEMSALDSSSCKQSAYAAEWSNGSQEALDANHYSASL